VLLTILREGACQLSLRKVLTTWSRLAKGGRK